MRSRRWSLSVAVALFVSGCSSTSDSSGSTLPDDGATTTIAVADSTDPSTTATPPAGGWTRVDVATIEGVLYFPCCGSDWYANASPPLPTEGGPLLDGDYFVRATWADDPSDPLEVEVFRFVSCATLPEGSCADGTSPDAIGVDHTNSVRLSLALDAELRVALIGFDGDEGDDVADAALATGVELAALAAAVEHAHATVFAARLAAGEDAQAIVEDVKANPIDGFGVNRRPPLTLEGQITFSYPGAPLLLFESPFNYDTDPPTAGRGVDVLGIPSISVRDGVITLHVYAGFYS